jgi:hypothetical protein
MAVPMIARPYGRVLPDRGRPDQGPAQKVTSTMASLLREDRSGMLLGGGVPGAITVAIGRADTWTYLAVPYVLAWTAVVLLGL